MRLRHLCALCCDSNSWTHIGPIKKWSCKRLNFEGFPSSRKIGRTDYWIGSSCQLLRRLFRLRRWFISMQKMWKRIVPKYRWWILQRLRLIWWLNHLLRLSRKRRQEGCWLQWMQRWLCTHQWSLRSLQSQQMCRLFKRLGEMQFLLWRPSLWSISSKSALHFLRIRRRWYGSLLGMLSNKNLEWLDIEGMP